MLNFSESAPGLYTWLIIQLIAHVIPFHKQIWTTNEFWSSGVQTLHILQNVYCNRDQLPEFHLGSNTTISSKLLNQGNFKLVQWKRKKKALKLKNIYSLMKLFFYSPFSQIKTKSIGWSSIKPMINNSEVLSRDWYWPTHLRYNREQQMQTKVTLECYLFYYFLGW